MALRRLPFSLVDVFANEPLAGNGLSVFLLDDELPTTLMQRITQEMRQFETIFLRPLDRPFAFAARIFTMEEELAFAGHPVIGAAAWLHAEHFGDRDNVTLEVVPRDRTIGVTSRRDGEAYFAQMDQGVATFEPPISVDQWPALLQALNLCSADLVPGLPLQVVSTGLPYLVVPIRSNLTNVRITVSDFEALLATVSAKFAYVFDVERREGRTWDNAGRVEDIATGSAAGPTAAYLVRHGLATRGETQVLAQGRFLGRPSALHATVTGDSELRVQVGGQVCLVGGGALHLPSKWFADINGGPGRHDGRALPSE